MRLTVHLSVSDHSYPIVIEKSLHEQIAFQIKAQFPASRYTIVTNTTLASLYADTLAQWKRFLDCSLYEMPDGEKYKTIETWSSILNFLLEQKLERSSVIIAFGGGVVGDVTGFAAAAFLRGVSFVQIPTTLLAMVDSSVGGKTAVDHPLGKNLIGAFHQPKSVFVDVSFLGTLSDREFMSGYAELFKYAFIGGADMFDFVRTHHDAMVQKDPDALLEGIQRSISVKAHVVEQDEHEISGVRALLNFGHTFAHALERYYNFGDILHGEAVWWGMRCAIEYSRRCGVLRGESEGVYQHMEKLIAAPTLPHTPDPAVIYEMMFTDKKVSGGKLRLVLPSEPGASVVHKDISAEIIKDTMVSIFT